LNAFEIVPDRKEKPLAGVGERELARAALKEPDAKIAL